MIFEDIILQGHITGTYGNLTSVRVQEINVPHFGPVALSTPILFSMPLMAQTGTIPVRANIEMKPNGEIIVLTTAVQDANIWKSIKIRVRAMLLEPLSNIAKQSYHDYMYDQWGNF